MTIKLFEIRDRATCIPVMCIEVTGSDGWLLRRAGFGTDLPCYILINLTKMECQYDPYSWETSARTMPVAHEWIRQNWAQLDSGDVVDVEYATNESLGVIKKSERPFAPPPPFTQATEIETD